MKIHEFEKYLEDISDQGNSGDQEDSPSLNDGEEENSSNADNNINNTADNQ